MSKVVKGIKKVFKKVVKVIKKVVPIVLAAAAIYFTAGQALGLTAAWGSTAAGGSSIAAGITSSLGTGVIGSTVTGALSAAGYGAAIGGITSAAMGGSFSQGAKRGAISGAVVGGTIGLGKGLLNLRAANAANAGTAKTFPMPETPPLPEGTYIDAAGNPIAAPPPTGELIAGGNPALGSFDGPTPPNNPTTPTAPPSADGATGGYGQSPPVQSDIPPIDTDITAGTNTGGDVQTPTPDPGFFAKNGWLERNGELAGGAIKGVGQGLMAGSAADSDINFLREQQNILAANYAGTDPGRQYKDIAPVRKDRYDPSSYGSWEYQYDPAQGRIIKVPVGA